MIQLTLTLKMTTTQLSNDQSLSATVLFRTTYIWTIMLHLHIYILVMLTSHKWLEIFWGVVSSDHVTVDNCCFLIYMCFYLRVFEHIAN